MKPQLGKREVVIQKCDKKEEYDGMCLMTCVFMRQIFHQLRLASTSTMAINSSAVIDK